MFFTIIDNVKVKPAPGLTTTCHLCGEAVTSRCGVQNKWHFSHLVKTECSGELPAPKFPFRTFIANIEELQISNAEDGRLFVCWLNGDIAEREPLNFWLPAGTQEPAWLKEVLFRKRFNNSLNLSDEQRIVLNIKTKKQIYRFGE